MTNPGQRGRRDGGLLALSAFIGLMLCVPAQAYLDPGSGGMLIQGLAAFFFGVAGTLTVVFRRARSIWNDKDKKNADDDA